MRAGSPLLAAGFLCTSVPFLSAATITVTTTANSGAGSLRDAITQSNASVGVLDTIAFAIPGTGVHLISITSDLDIVSDPVVIDGTTQPGYAGSPLIDIAGNPANNGLRISAGSSTIRGIAIRGFATDLLLFTNGDNTIEKCYIGTNPAQNVLTNGNGLYLQNSPGNRIGGSSAGTGNLISGATGTGLTVLTSNDTTIQGNRIGTDAAGTAALPNGSGISIVGSTDVAVGGTSAGEGNLISGNSGDGIHVTASAGVLIAGNLIGTDVTGTQPLGNNFGIDANSLTGSLAIGSPIAAGRNVISGNNQGIFLNNGVHDATILNNYLGTDLAGVAAVPNTQAILMNTNDTSGVQIGGPGPGEGNLIAFNHASGGAGAIWNLGSRVTIRGNSIHSNDALGIDNGFIGVDPNDPGDGDTGANEGQNFPVLSSVGPALSQGTGTRIQGVLHSAPSTTYVLDFYDNGDCTNFPREFVEGATYMGNGQVTTEASGTGVFDVTVSATVAPDSRISATATDPDGNTSEMSQRIVFSMTPASGDPTGGADVTIDGTDFDPSASVTVGGVALGNVAVPGDTRITGTSPPLPAGSANDVVVTNPDGTTGTLVKGWVSDFLDVPVAHGFHSFVATLVSNGITAGIGNGLYGVDEPTLRQQMAVFLLKARFGLCYAPPPCQSVFDDVPCPSTFADWIEDLAARGITGGCSTTPPLYCPQNPVRRDQMAVFLLKTRNGSSYAPPACTGVFDDVPCPSQFADWIEQLAEEQITGGCSVAPPLYCPQNNNTRGQMAVFIVKTFSLQ